MNRTVIKLTYHGVVLSKKNRHITTRQGAVVPDAKARANEQEMIRQFMIGLKGQGGSEIFTKTATDRLIEAKQRGVYYRIGATFYHQNGRRKDLDNEMTSVLDALTKSGAIVDDCRQFVREIVVKDGGIDKSNPRAEITIVKMEDGGGAL